jgi:hypothetical protein
MPNIRPTIVPLPFTERVLLRSLDCCGSRIVIRTKGQRWMCPCGRKHVDSFVQWLCTAAPTEGVL